MNISVVLAKSEIRQIRSLSQKKFRDQTGLFVVEGEKLVREALYSSFEVVKICRADEIGEEAMSRITMLSSPSPVLAVVRRPEPSGRKPEPSELSLALDSVRDPGNLGTIIRIADWFGIKRIFASADTVEVFNPKVVQATMGAIFRVEVIYCDLAVTLSEAAGRGIPVYGTFLEGDNIYSAELSPEGIVVMGSESNGISPEIGGTVTKRVHIPAFPEGSVTSESLNVAVATAITCSEFRRRLAL